MSDLQHDLAALVHRFRKLTVPNATDWDLPGIRAAIDRCEGSSPCEVAAAAFVLAARADMNTPALLHQPGSWWNKGAGMSGPRVSMNVPCVDHPTHDMPCPHRDHRGDMTREQIADAARAVRAARAAATTKPQPQETR